MLPRSCQNGTGQGQWVDFDELWLLDAEVSEELSVPAHVEGSRGSYRDRCVSLLLQDDVPFEEAAVGKEQVYELKHWILQ